MNGEEHPPALPAPEVLEQQMQHSAMHLHSVLSGFADRVNAMESLLYGLADALVASNVVSVQDLEAQTRRVAQEIDESGQRLVGGAMIRIDQTRESQPSIVNCMERMPICKAVCCKLNFPLSAEEIESGKYKWELGRPYFIRHGSEGYCVHLAQSGGGCACNVYDDRPRICKTYSCEGDTRIWKDFDGMVLNEEWISANLGEDRMRFIQPRMDA